MQPAKDYDRVAFAYDFVAAIGSGGAIGRTKEHQRSYLRRGERVLFAGSGTGADAVAAARIGCAVTCVDASRRMLTRAATRARRHGVAVDCVHADIRSYEPSAPFDAVCANHLLNVWADGEAQRLLGRLARMVRPAGLVLIADFAPARGPRDLLLHAHWVVTVAIGATLRLCDRHGLHDPASWSERAGLTTIAHRRHAVLGVLPAYQSLVLRRTR